MSRLRPEVHYPIGPETAVLSSRTRSDEDTATACSDRAVCSHQMVRSGEC